MDRLRLGYIAGRIAICLACLSMILAAFTKCTKESAIVRGKADSAVAAYVHHAYAGKAHSAIHISGAAAPDVSKMIEKFGKLGKKENGVVEFTLDGVAYSAKVVEASGEDRALVEIYARMPGGNRLKMYSAEETYGNEPAQLAIIEERVKIQANGMNADSPGAIRVKCELNSLFLKVWLKLWDELGRKEDARQKQIDNLLEEKERIEPLMRIHQYKADSIERRLDRIDAEVKGLKKLVMNPVFERMAFPSARHARAVQKPEQQKSGSGARAIT